MLAAFFALGIAFLAAGAAVGIADAATDWTYAHWLALHLVFVGGISQLVLGAGQFFAGAFLATDPPPRRLVRAQLGAWNAGAVLVAAGVPAGLDSLSIAGGALLAAGLAAFVAGLRGLRRQSLQRAPWALRWYEACAVFLGVGVLAGVALATGAGWTAGSLVGAHMALNLAGWFGTAIVGTLHTFFPSLTRTRLRFPGLQAPTFIAWTLGTTSLAAGYAFAVDAPVVAGWAGLGVAALVLCANLAGSLAATEGALSLSARLIAAAQACLLLALALALADALGGDATAGPTDTVRSAMAVLLLPGWLGATVLGALLHLLSVLLRVRDLRHPLPEPRPVRDRALVALAVLGVLGLAVGRAASVDELALPAGVAIASAYAVLGALVVSRAARMLRGGLPRV
jgi:nitrite reductase (NO-forming)